jgi:hypothetical protein
MFSYTRIIYIFNVSTKFSVLAEFAPIFPIGAAILATGYFTHGNFIHGNFTHGNFTHGYFTH